MIDVLLEKADTVAPALAFARYKRRKAVELLRNLKYYSSQYWNNNKHIFIDDDIEYIRILLESDIEDLNESIKLMENLK